jgi:HTH-type transcriptional regulator, cell division transcriptional repressor
MYGVPYVFASPLRTDFRTSTVRPPQLQATEALGPRLRAARDAAGLTQETVADRLGVKRTRVSEWENGTHRPGADVLDRLAGLYGTTVRDLLRGEPPEGPEHRTPAGEPGTISIPRDLAMYYRGVLDTELRSLRNVSKTLEALRQVLDNSAGGIGELAESGVLPKPPGRIGRGRWEYVPEPPTAVDPDNGE